MSKVAIGIVLTLLLLGFVRVSDANQTAITMDEGAAFGIDAGDLGALQTMPVVAIEPEVKQLLENVVTVPNSSSLVVGTTGIR